jgi:uncharacterized protein
MTTLNASVLGETILLLSEGPGDTLSATAPVRRAERITSLDILRGIAVLGILMMNIDSFAGPEFGAPFPVGLPKPAFVGPHAHLNLVILFLKWVFFEGKMRALFSMLFGAGVILLTSRAEKRGAGIKTADIYFRRNMWLCVLGLLHGIFLWSGDVLFDYGLCALIFLFPLRALKPKTLLTLGILLSVVLGTYKMASTSHTLDDINLSRQAAAIAADLRAGKMITAEQEQLQQKWKATVDKEAITQPKIDEGMAEAHEGYLAWLTKTGLSYGRFGLTEFYTGGVGDATGAMLIGMALYKYGFLTAELSYATYLWTAVSGFLISIPLYIVGIWKIYLSGFSFLAIDKWALLPYQLTRVSGALAIAAVLLILIKSGIFRVVLRPFAAVGQTALSNYLLTTALCQTLFLWGPSHLYGKLEYYQYCYVVFGVWTVNLILSSFWLRAFEFGPAEWLWRSLTHWRLQPMRIRA